MTKTLDLSRPLTELLDEHAAEKTTAQVRITAAVEGCAAMLPAKTGTKLRPIYELAVRLESHGHIQPDPDATEADMRAAIGYALQGLAEQRDRERDARVQAEAFRDAKRVA